MASPLATTSTPDQSEPRPHLRTSSRQSSTSSVYSIKRKPVPTEFDQLRQLATDFVPGSSAPDADEEVLRDATTSYPPAPQPLPLPARPATASSSSSSHASRSVFGSRPEGTIGQTVPREVIRIERDYSSATNTVQFFSGWIWELEGRVSPTIYQEILNDLNAILVSAHDPLRSIFDNTLAVLTLWISPLVKSSHYNKEMVKFVQRIEQVNRDHLNPVGLNLLDPERTAYLFLELEYY
ncbi:ERF4 family protein [Sporobolomyces koalae]|uniref:ERF4 family protein n=1 Tax=Sporobolomyces koalae TaxID=500713 RepID=UPI003177F713